ncbi:MAG: DUF1295 domain-containing protein [Pseudomonadales bacterium]
MKKSERQAIAALPIILVVAALVAVAGSSAGQRAFGVPVFALCALLSFVINWLVFVPSYLARTEHYFDLTGSTCYVTLTLVALLLTPSVDARGVVLGVMVIVWALRLGSFLFLRVRRSGRDARFDEMKQSFPRFLMAWTLQGLWVLFTAACALTAISATAALPLDAFALIGSLLWLAGFAMEVIADAQKSAFKADPDNADRFISSGLWAWSRHPNYAGEILLWLGIAVIAYPALQGWQLATLISPVFVYVLLTRISGIPLLESRANRKWGDDPAYQDYKARTPVLWPRPPRS